MSKPMGCPRKLTPQAEQLVYDRLKATKHGKRWKVYVALARELKVSVPTLQRAVTRATRQHLAAMAARLHELHQKSEHIEVNP